MKRILFFLVIILAILVASKWSTIKMANKYYLSPCYYDGPVKQTDFPHIYFEVDLDSYYQEVIGLATVHFKVDTLYSVEYKGKQYPILNITKSASNNAKSIKKMLVLAGVHGNESGGTLAILELLHLYNQNPATYDDWELQIVTPINPAGTIEMSRHNENGCDLNRKVKSSTEHGIVMQRELLTSYKPDVIVSLHEAPSSDFLIHSNNELDEVLLEHLLSDVEEQGIVLATEDYLGRSLDVSGNSKIKGGLKFLKDLVQVQSLGDYASEQGIIEITTESGWNSQDTFQRVNSHVYIIASVAEHF